MARQLRSANLAKNGGFRCGIFAFAILLALSLVYMSLARSTSANDAAINFHHGSEQGLGALGSQYTTEAPGTAPNGTRVAFIIESDASKASSLFPIMLHFVSVLGPAWSVVLFTLEKHWELPSSPAVLRAMQQHQIQIRFLPAQTQLTDSQSVSRFLTKPWIWTQLYTAHRALMFQLDSVICSRSVATVEDFFEYDFVGAPIDAKYGEGFNGGFSLRNPALFLSITDEVDFQSSGAEFEDQWFYSEAKKRVAHGVTLPTKEIAERFSVETIYYDKPLGYHQPQRWQEAKMDDIKEWCPEVGMLVGRRAV